MEGEEVANTVQGDVKKALAGFADLLMPLSGALVKRRILFLPLLFAAVGNAWATGQLSNVVSIPKGAIAELIIFITPTIKGPTPAACKEVEITPVIADVDVNGSATPSSDEISIETFEIAVEKLEPFMLVPGEFAKMTVPNANGYRINRAFEFLMAPAEALGHCGPKASVLVIGSDGMPLGAPTSLNEQFKAYPEPAGPMIRR
ncbi:MAG: hypothetical protein ABFS23_08375 [Pseudomonadota bacterium]